jgi:4-phosphopantoate--beta-alanine ligase
MESHIYVGGPFRCTMTDIPPSHPRRSSLLARERLVEGVRAGIVSEAGLIAHGRGEAFDYLLGERTTEEAVAACRAAAALLLLARRPVMSVNGNVAALASEAAVALASRVGEARGARGAAEAAMRLEVNLFHRTEERVRAVADRLRAAGARDVLGERPDMRVPGLDHARALCSSQGVGSADVVLIPLEDGDRAEALRRWGRTAIAVDLNPMSRTARAARVTVVDELTRALPVMAREVAGLAGEPDGGLRAISEGFDNAACLRAALARMVARMPEVDLGPPG